jgi:hypothetical protein
MTDAVDNPRPVFRPGDLVMYGTTLRYLGRVTRVAPGAGGRWLVHGISLSTITSNSTFQLDPDSLELAGSDGGGRSLREAIGLLSDYDALAKRTAAFLDREVKR